MFFGKHFSSMYEGSMIGAGALVFAVMGYVIACQQKDKTVGSQVHLNSKLLGPILGESPEDVEKAIEYLCAPDDESTTKKEQGRRLIKIGQFAYQVVNGAKYLKIRDEETRRAQNREAQRRKRSKENGSFGPSSCETIAEKIHGDTGHVPMASEHAKGTPFNPGDERGSDPVGDPINNNGEPENP